MRRRPPAGTATRQRGLWLELALLPALALSTACSGERAGGSGDDRAGAGTHVLSEGSLGPVRARLRGPKDAPRFGDRIPLTLEIEAGPEAKLEDLASPSRFGHFRVRSKSGAETKDGVRRLAFVVEAERTGANLGAVPPIRFKVISGEGAGAERELRLPAFEYEVAGLAAGETPDLAALEMPLGLVALPRPAAERTWMWTAGAALVALAALGLAWRRLLSRRRAESVPELDPAEEARLAFDRLLASPLLSGQRFGDFYVELTRIVRRFIERTTGVHAPKQTTEEFLREIESRRPFPPEQASALAAFLESADLVKFAGQVPGSDEVARAVGAARRFCRVEAGASDPVRGAAAEAAR